MYHVYRAEAGVNSTDWQLDIFGSFPDYITKAYVTQHDYLSFWSNTLELIPTDEVC